MINSETEITVTASGYPITSILGATFANLCNLTDLNEIIDDPSEVDVLDKHFTAIMIGDGNGNFRYSYRLKRPGKISVFVQEFEHNTEYVWHGSSQFTSGFPGPTRTKNSSDLEYSWNGVNVICGGQSSSLSMLLFFWIRPPTTGTYELQFSASVAIGSYSRFHLRDIPSVLIGKWFSLSHLIIKSF